MALPQSGNIAWKAASIKVRMLPGMVNRRRCKKIKASGTQCGAVAVNGCDFCLCHGGRQVVAARKRAKLRKRNKLPARRWKRWTDKNAERNT